MKRLCPACRLPRPPSKIHIGEERGAFVVFGVCGACTARYQRLPHGPRHKLLNGASARAAADPARYLAGLFPELGAAQIVSGMLSHPRHADAAVDLLGWRFAAG
jgi:hypothetical protein